MQQDGKILLNPSWNVPCEVDLISIDYQIIRCVVEGWIEIQNCIVWNRTKWSWLKILKIQHRLFLQISFYFESISLKSYIFCLVWSPFEDFQYENLPAMIGGKNIKENLAISRGAAKQARKLCIQISNLFPPFKMVACT